MSNSAYIYGDIHNHIENVSLFLNKKKPEKVIWLGDWFDSWGDSAKDAERTAKFLLSILKNRPNDIFILSNHDIAYMFPKNKEFQTWGWTREKSEAINKHITQKHWDRFKIVHFEQFGKTRVLFSHAGWDSLPVANENLAAEISIRKQCEMALKCCAANKLHYVTHSMKGPLWSRSIPVWCDYYQVFGHTPVSKPIISYGYQTCNVNFDCAHTFLGFIDGKGIRQIRHGVKMKESMIVPFG